MTTTAASWPETLELLPVRAPEASVDQPVFPPSDAAEVVGWERVDTPPRKKPLRRRRRRAGARRFRRAARANADQPAVVCIAITAVFLVGGLLLFLM